MPKKNIVVVGAGFGGVFAAKLLSHKLKSQKDYDIILIDKHSYFTYMTELHEVASQRVAPQHVQEDLEHLFYQHKNVKLLTAEVNGVDKSKRIVSTTQGDIPYEKLILAVGGQSNDFGTPGVKEHGFELWSMEESLTIRNHIENTVGQGAAELDPVKREQMLTIAVVGSGFTGTELMGEFIEQRKVLAKTYKLDENEIKLVMLEASPQILNMLKDRKLADKAYRYMTEHGVDIRTDSRVTSVDETGITFADGSRLATRSLIWTAGVKAKSFISDWGFKYGRGGRIEADDYMRATSDDDSAEEHIYVAGDTLSYVDKTTGPVPQTVEGAENAAKTAVINILADLGLGSRKTFTDVVKYHGFAVSIGSHYTVASLLKNINISGFMAGMAKHAINLYFYSQIRSAYSIFNYTLDEFFRTENGRNPFRGTISRLGNVLWATPLRLLLGVFWILAALGNLNTGMNDLFWQQGIASFLELIVGSGLILGLFTWPLGLVSIILAISAWAMNGFDVIHWFLILGSLAIMNGSGRGIGLDFFVVPLLQKWFGQLWYGKAKSYYDEIHK